MTKRILLIVTMLTLISASILTAKAQEDVDISGKQVCYLIPDAGNPFLAALTEAVQSKFAEDGVEVLIYGAEGNAQTQFNQIENCISIGVDAMIVMAALEPEGVESAVLEAKDEGIMVMGVPVNEQGPYDAIMHTDQYEIGTLQAQMACDWINATYPDAAEDSIEVAVIGTKGTELLKQRTEGMETIEDCPQASIVQTLDVPDPTISIGVTSAENVFTANPDVKVILITNDGGAQGVSEAIAAYAPDNLDEYAVFSGDVSPDNSEVIQSCESAYRGAVAIGGGPEELAENTYHIVKGMISGTDFPAEFLDPLVTITCGAEEMMEESVDISGKQVCYLIPDAGNPFLAALTEAVQSRFAEDGVEVLIYGAEGNAQTQFNQIENCISIGVDAMIVMAALEPEGVESAVLEAKDEGIMVMGVPVNEQGPYDAIMHTDQYEIGTLQAQMACDWINATYPDAAEDSIEVAVIGTKGTELLKQRTEGMETIEDCPQASIVQTLDVPDPTISIGVTSAENVFTANPDVKVILITNDGGAQGVSEAIAAYAPDNLNEYAVFSGDVSPDNSEVIQSCESAYRGAVAIGGGPEELAENTYNIVKGMISGTDFPAEFLDPLVTITCE